MSEPVQPNASMRRGRLTAILLVGSASVAFALHRGAMSLGPLPRAEDPLVGAVDRARQDDASSRLVHALELERAGDLQGAAREAAAAFELGGDRDAALLAAKIAILQERWEDAEARLGPLVAANPDDAAAQYNLALVAHRRGRIDAARSGYEAALRADPRNAAARYNLALLEWNAGSTERARAHLTAFTREFPDDPRGSSLSVLMKRPR